MNTDTPRTDDEESRIQCDLSSMKLAGWNAAYHEMKEHAQKLEGELTAVTEQRDEVREELAGIENKMRLELGGHPDSELWGNAGLIAATMRCVEAIGMIEEMVTTDHETKEAFIQRVRGILGHNPSAEATNIGMFIKDGRGE
jgi:hypothetical protein